jgi:glycosyltransferase involved in cell wall biosynthesis
VRVIFLTPSYPRWPGDFSGASLGALARALLRRGVSVRVVAPSEEPGGQFELDGVPVHRVRLGASSSGTQADHDGSSSGLRNPTGWSALLRSWRVLRAGAKREIASGADLVHAHRWIPAGLATPEKIPLLLTVDGADASMLRRSRMARSLARRVFRRAAGVTAVSREVGQWVQNFAGRSVSASHIHPLPIETKGRPWTRGGGGAVVLAPLVEAARVDLAIQTVAVLASCGHDLQLSIVGDGPEREALEQQARRLGVSSLIRFAGELPPDQARVHLAKADVLLFTAQGDGAALPALEALITGVPVVACWDSGAAVDIVPESGAGRLTLPSAEALADSVLELQADGDRLAMSRLVGEAWRARLAPDNVAELCEGWYRDALAR